MNVDPLDNGRMILKGTSEEVDMLGSAVEALASDSAMVEARHGLHAEHKSSIEELRAIVGGFEEVGMRDGTTRQENVVSHSGVVSRLRRGTELLVGHTGLTLHATGEDPNDSDLARRQRAFSKLSADLDEGLAKVAK